MARVALAGLPAGGDLQRARAAQANPNTKAKPTPTPEQTMATAAANLRKLSGAKPPAAPKTKAPRPQRPGPTMKQKVQKFERRTAMY